MTCEDTTNYSLKCFWDSLKLVLTQHALLLCSSEPLAHSMMSVNTLDKALCLFRFLLCHFWLHISHSSNIEFLVLACGAVSYLGLFYLYLPHIHLLTISLSSSPQAEWGGSLTCPVYLSVTALVILHHNDPLLRGTSTQTLTDLLYVVFLTSLPVGSGPPLEQRLQSFLETDTQGSSHHEAGLVGEITGKVIRRRRSWPGSWSWAGVQMETFPQAPLRSTA